MWLHLPESCRFSADAEDSISESNSQPEPRLWLTLSAKPTQRPLSWHGWKTRSWHRLLSGTTLRPSMATRGAASWIASLAAAPVRTCPSPASALASMVLDQGFGEKCSGLLSKQSLLSFSGKTSGEPSPPPSTWLRTTLAVSVTELQAALSLLKMSEPHTNESGSSCWPTPTAQRYGTQPNPGAPPPRLVGCAREELADAELRRCEGTEPQHHQRKRFDVNALASNPGFPPRRGDEDAWRRWRGPQPGIRRGVDGIADWMDERNDRLRATGNGVVPQQAAAAFLVCWRRLFGGS